MTKLVCFLFNVVTVRQVYDTALDIEAAISNMIAAAHDHMGKGL